MTNSTRDVGRSRGLSRGWAALVAAVAGAGIWGETMGSAPRYSFGPDQDTGSFGACLVGLALAALLLGLLTPRFPAVVGAVVTGVPLLLAPWTAPRGDNDGLWVLILPMLALNMGATLLASWIGAAVSTTHRRAKEVTCQRFRPTFARWRGGRARRAWRPSIAKRSRRSEGASCFSALRVHRPDVRQPPFDDPEQHHP